MTDAAALSCPKCRRKLGELDWHDERSGSCRECGAAFEALIFSARTRRRSVVRPQAAAIAEDSTCFFHAENQAEHVCNGCGRFLCAVCSIPFGGAYSCPRCIAGQKMQAATLIPHRILFDSAALSLAIVPLLLWPFTLLSAPAALGVVVFGWKKPCSLVRGRRRWKQVVAGLIALAEIGVWIFVFVQLWLK